MCKSDLRNKILKVDISYEDCLKVKEILQQEDVQQKYEGYRLELDRIIMPNNRVYVPNFGELRKLVKNEMHIVPYVGHLGSQKTFA